MCLAPKAQRIHRQPGAAPRVHGTQEKVLALKARFTRDVIRSIIGSALISASGMFGIENHH
jgi:hypothetical protein